MAHKSPCCNSNLRALASCSEPEGIRSDVYCPKCKQVYMCTKAALFPIDAQIVDVTPSDPSNG